MPTVIALTETWLLDQHTQLYAIPGYDAYFSCRANMSAGIAMYVKSDYKSELMEMSNGLVSYLKLKVNFGCDFMYVSTFYMPCRRDYASLFETLEVVTGENVSSKHVIVGDFNIDVNQSDSIVNEYFGAYEMQRI